MLAFCLILEIKRIQYRINGIDTYIECVYIFAFLLIKSPCILICFFLLSAADFLCLFLSVSMTLSQCCSFKIQLFFYPSTFFIFHTKYFFVGFFGSYFFVSIQFMMSEFQHINIFCPVVCCVSHKAIKSNIDRFIHRNR